MHVHLPFDVALLENARVGGPVARLRAPCSLGGPGGWGREPPCGRRRRPGASPRRTSASTPPWAPSAGPPALDRALRLVGTGRRKGVHVADDEPERRVPPTSRPGVQEQEACSMLSSAMEDRPANAGARWAVGRPWGGRYIRVIHLTDPVPDSEFVLRAYELGPRAQHALRRRGSRRP
jgi:hypothetical protein